MKPIKVKVIYTQTMIDDLTSMMGIDLVAKLESVLVERQMIYEKRKRIIEKILKENKTSSKQ